MGMLSEFKEFASRGNMVDLAVGVVIGAAFGKIVDSLVKDLLNPLIGLAGSRDFSNFFLVMKEGEQPGPYPNLAKAAEAGAVTLNYGAFLTALLNFLIVAAALFVVVKAVNKLRRPAPAPAAPAAPPEPSDEVKLLTEIRDALRR